MKSNILAFFLTIGSIALAALIIWFYNMSDKDAPEMRFVAMELTYDSNTTEDQLLEGVMAYDVVDGDITDRVVVEKTILDEEQGTAVVYYAVSDLSGNVTKQSRVFPADIEDIQGANDGLAEDEHVYPAGFSLESGDLSTDQEQNAESEGPLENENEEAGGDESSSTENSNSDDGASSGDSNTAGN